MYTHLAGGKLPKYLPTEKNRMNLESWEQNERQGRSICLALCVCVCVHVYVLVYAQHLTQPDRHGSNGLENMKSCEDGFDWER
jgi:hypothetical protein